MLYIAHRVNTADQLARTPREYGVELDLRDRGPRLIVQHDPFADGEDFEEYLKHYDHGLMILNVKSERIEPRVLDAIRTAGVRQYFFLDCSFPMIRWLVGRGERRIAVRFSEFEPIESALALAGQVEWVWVDCFTKLPLDARSYAALKRHFRLCIVSPELQGRSVDTIADYVHELVPFPVDAVCTKRPDLWQQARREIGWGAMTFPARPAA
ncbi:MAG TPA: phosphatidylinositol-specific phospholipase C/glycerophosphodiester phosphodiesterase family protein [Pirellulaceae bacterium]|nr:phosphatidylinositol-specific phospholipase C/glycerophosphodiester phosphodiesterase family protein [Pirellulaceae bacterium]